MVRTTSTGSGRLRSRFTQKQTGDTRPDGKITLIIPVRQSSTWERVVQWVKGTAGPSVDRDYLDELEALDDRASGAFSIPSEKWKR